MPAVDRVLFPTRGRFWPQRGKYRVDPIEKAYREKVEPNTDWPEIGRKVQGIRRRCKIATNFYVKNSRLSETSSYGRENSSIYFWYVEEVGGESIGKKQREKSNDRDDIDWNKYSTNDEQEKEDGVGDFFFFFLHYF